MARSISSLIVKMKSEESSLVHQLDVQQFIIGRSKEADFTFSNEEVSRKHLLVFIKDNQIFLKDLGSKNGTFVNGKKIPAHTDYMYVEGNPITLGKSRAIFRISAERHEPVREHPQSMGVPLEDADDTTDIISIPTDIPASRSEEGQKSPFHEQGAQVKNDEVPVPGQIYDLEDSVDLENSGLSEILGKEKSRIPKEMKEEQRPHPFLQQDVQKNKTSSQPYPELPRIPSSRGGTNIRRINPKSKRGGFKSPSELMVEVVREVAGAIDKQFINIPEDKRAKKKGEKILEEVHRLSVELRQKGYEKHDEIIQKAVNKAHFILEEAEKDREKFLDSGRKKILSIERRKLQDAEVEANRILEDARDRADQLIRETQMRVDKMEAESSIHAMKLKDQAADEMATAKTRAAEIISDAEGHSAEVLHRLEATKKAIQDELNFLENKKSGAEDEIENLTDTIKSLDQQRMDARRAATEAQEQQQAEEARLEYEKQRVLKEVEKAEASVRERHEDVQRQLKEYQEQQGELEMKFAAEQELFNQKKKSVQKEFYKYKSGLEEKLASEEARFQASVSQLNQQLAKNRERLDGEWKGHQNDHQRKLEDLSSSLSQLQVDYREKLAAEEKEYNSRCQELAVSLEKHKKDIEDQITYEKDRYRETVHELQERIQVKSDEHEKINDQLIEISNQMQQRKSDNQTILDKLDRAEGDYSRLTAENEVLKSDNNDILREIGELRSRKGKIERAIDDLESAHQKEVENLAIMKSETLEKIRNDKLSAQAEIERLLKEAQKSKKDILDQAHSEKNHMIQKAQSQSEEILRHAQEKYEVLQKEGEKLRAEAESYTQNLSEQVDSWKKEQELEVTKKQENLEEEIQKRLKASKKDLEMELADLRVKREKELEQSLADIRSEHDEKLQAKAEIIARAMDQKMVSKIRPHLKSSETNTLMDDLSVDLQKTILHILDPSKEYADEDLRRVIGINTANMVKDANFRKKAIAVVAILFVVTTSGFWWDRFKTHTAEMASKQKKELDAKVQEVEEKRKNKPKFEPELKAKYLSTYTDRVLYTENYVNNELEKDYRQEWILKLNEFFVNDLGLSENVIVTFIAKESNVLKDLQSMREGINPQFVKESREDMLKLEKRFTDEVRRVLKSKKNYKKFQSFKQKYYEKVYSESH